MMIFNNNKGQIGLFFTWVIISIVFITLAAIVAPMGVYFNTEMVAAAENIYTQTNSSLQQISDPTIKASIQGVVDESFEAGTYNIEVTNNLYKYMWVILLIITAIIFYVYSRRSVEFASGGGFV